MNLDVVLHGLAETGQHIITNAGAFASLAGGIAAVVGTLLAWRGVNTWKREYLFKINSELLEEALVLFYQAEHAIAYLRNGFIFTKELDNFEFPQNMEDGYSKDMYKYTFTIHKRFDEKQEIFDKLYAIELRFRARFRREPTDEFASMKELAKLLLLAASQYALKDLDKDRIQELKRVIWQPYDPKDAFGCRVTKVISAFETRCDKLMCGRSR